MELTARLTLVMALLGLACSGLPFFTATPTIQCTPPPCPNSVYDCPGNCPGGCGTRCGATFTATVSGPQIITATPTPTPLQDTSPASPTPVDFPAPPDPSKYSLALVADGFNQPDYVTHAGDGSGRLFVVEQPGTIRIIAGGQTLPETFLDIRRLIRSSGSEQGLLGLAFHPGYGKTSSYFFVNYTDTDGNTVVARYSVSADPNLADPNSAETVLYRFQPYEGHNGGDLVFGPDGYLYIGLGDGGSFGDPRGNAQDLHKVLGKMLRIDVDQTEPYGIPPGNPFVGRDARPEVWAYGLRNPWRYSFDRATGDLYIGDVGQDKYEEVDFQAAASAGGENYGWNFMEGLHPFEGQAPGGLTPPILEYAHSEGGCAVIGGYVYRGAQLPDISGVYLFGDLCSGRISGLYRIPPGTWQQKLLLESGLSISSFGEDEAGELYVVDHNGGIYRLTAR